MTARAEVHHANNVSESNFYADATHEAGSLETLSNLAAASESDINLIATLTNTNVSRKKELGKLHRKCIPKKCY